MTGMNEHISLFLFLLNIYNMCEMKKNFLRITTASIILAFGVGVFAGINQKPTETNATQHIANYDPYKYTGHYYDNLDKSGTSGTSGTFKTTLGKYIFPKGWYTYGSSGQDHLSTQLQYADEDPTNSENMVYLYTRDSVKKNAAGTWNREHVWPQSLSNGNWGTDKAGTDLLHIRPTYNTTNSTRGNDKYGDTNKASNLTYNGMLYGYSNGSYFEPLDEVKGDVARIIMYVWVTYSDYSSYSNFYIRNVFQSIDTMIKWHTMDKPDALEGHRNDYSETSIQKNRNPFVDHPEYAWQIFGNEISSSTIKNDCITTYPADGNWQSETPSKELSKIEISGTASKKDYYAGETFNPSGLTVTATYSDGSTAVIPNNNCEWNPDPLTEGTTSVVCKYANKSATYQGITVTKKVVSNSEFSVEFIASGEDSGTRLTGAEVLNNYTKNNSLIESVTSAANVFPGKSGLKLGSSNSAGEIVISLVNGCRTEIEQVEVQTTAYGSDTAKVSILLGNTSLGEFTPGQKITCPVNYLSANTLTISTTTKRAYLNSILVRVKEETPEPPISSSEPTSSSIEESSSSEQLSSSSEYSSSIEESSSEIISESESSSSVEPIESSNSEIISSSSEETSNVISSNAISEEDISSIEETSSAVVEPNNSSDSEVVEPENSSSAEPIESSSEETIVSTSSSVISIDSSETSTTPSSNNGETKKRVGCNGSVTGMFALTGLTTLIGLTFVFFKKKQ